MIEPPHPEQVPPPPETAACKNAGQALRCRLLMSGSEFTPVEDAAAEVGVQLLKVHAYIREGLLRGWQRPGDARTFVDLEELRRLRGWGGSDPSPPT